MEKGTYKTFQLGTEFKQNGVYTGKLELPKDVKILSVCGPSKSCFFGAPICCISMIGDFSKPEEFIDYNFLLIQNSPNQPEVFLDGYQHISLVSLNSYSGTTYDYDVFYKRIN